MMERHLLDHSPSRCMMLLKDQQPGKLKDFFERKGRRGGGGVGFQNNTKSHIVKSRWLQINCNMSYLCKCYVFYHFKEIP